MKTPFNKPSQHRSYSMNAAGSRLPVDPSFKIRPFCKKGAAANHKLLTPEARAEIAQQGIPDLSKVCRDLYATFLNHRYPHSALQFVPILKQMPAFSQEEVKRFLANPQSSHVLVENDLLKVVLIHWETGKYSSIHGHAQGGCVFKVLQGKVEEKRYSPDGFQEYLGLSTVREGGMAYIDDVMAHHAVGNPFEKPAISLHVYTQGQGFS